MSYEIPRRQFIGEFKLAAERRPEDGVSMPR
jgi:hypothetical protein